MVLMLSLGLHIIKMVTQMGEKVEEAYLINESQKGNIFMQKFDSSGDKVGVETSVNTYYNSAQNDSMITGLNNGSFVATWMEIQMAGVTSYGQDGSYNGIYMQRFSS